MRKRTYILIAWLVLSIIVESCSQNKTMDDGFEQTETGMKYKFIEKNESRTPDVGDIITFHLAILNEEDSILSATFQGHSQPIKTAIPQPSFKGSLEEGLAMMAKGDSAVFMVSLDSIYKDRQDLMPPNLKGSKYLKYRVRMLNVQTLAEIQAEEFEKNKEQRIEQDNMIQEYLAKKGLEGTPTASGLYHIVTKEGNGESPTANNEVTVHYVGMLLNETVFDTSVPGRQPGRTLSGEPATFPLGGVIQGWQEGLALMKKGESALILMPSYLGYGPQGTRGIPPDSPLVFEVDLIDFK